MADFSQVNLKMDLNMSTVREQSFLILGTGVEDFLRGYENFSLTFGVTKILKAILMEYKTILLEKFLMRSSIKD